MIKILAVLVIGIILNCLPPKVINWLWEIFIETPLVIICFPIFLMVLHHSPIAQRSFVSFLNKNSP